MPLSDWTTAQLAELTQAILRGVDNKQETARQTLMKLDASRTANNARLARPDRPTLDQWRDWREAPHIFRSMEPRS